MATPIKRIEKDFLLKVLFDEQIPLMMKYGRAEYVMTVEEPPKRELKLKGNRPLDGLRRGAKLEFMFDYRGQAISFTALAEESRDQSLTLEAPEFLYKNLTRSYSRVLTPADLKVVFSFHGDRYNLSFPKTTEYEPAEPPEYSDGFNPTNIKELINQLSVWAFDAASGHKLVMFRDSRPTAMEERIVAETGKALFIPSTQSDIPSVDPHPRKRIITEDIFKRFLESSGTDRLYVDETLSRFLKGKRDAGLYSDLWAPILFQEYVIGYIHLWIDTIGKPPFDPSVLDTLYQFAKVLAYSLKVNGYFRNASLKKEAFPGKVIDVSASGLLFSNPSAALASSLLPDSEIDIQLIAAKRTVRTAAKIVRRYKDSSAHYFGCRYTDIAPEDLRFLFEYLYGKPFTDADASFISRA